MGNLSRRRKQPRIVKKIKRKDNRQNVCVSSLDAAFRKNWV